MTSDRITILDGGMGKELYRMGAPFRQSEWSALALMEAPDLVADAHRNFVSAGAEVITTNTYALVPYHIGWERFDREGAKLAEVAASIARTVADETAAGGRSVMVSGSLPPLFGSYQPARFEPDRAPDLWRTLITPQIPHVDVWIGETMSCVDECRVLAQTLANVTNKPLWAAFTLADRLDEAGRPVLRSGEPLSAVADLITELAGRAESMGSGTGSAAVSIEAVLFNCSQPEVMEPALRELGPLLPEVRFGAYANAFDHGDSGHRREDDEANSIVMERRSDLTPDAYADTAGGWVLAGASIIGGCCDIYPEHIAELAHRFANART